MSQSGVLIYCHPPPHRPDHAHVCFIFMSFRLYLAYCLKVFYAALSWDCDICKTGLNFYLALGTQFFIRHGVLPNWKVPASESPPRCAALACSCVHSPADLCLQLQSGPPKRAKGEEEEGKHTCTHTHVRVRRRNRA